MQFINCKQCNEDSSDRRLLGCVIGSLCLVFLLLSSKRGDFSKTVSVRQVGIYPSYFIAGTSPQKSIGARKEQVPYSMGIENGNS